MFNFEYLVILPLQCVFCCFDIYRIRDCLFITDTIINVDTDEGKKYEVKSMKGFMLQSKESIHGIYFCLHQLIGRCFRVSDDSVRSQR